MDESRDAAGPADPSVRSTALRVMIVQVVTLVLLWLLQARFTS